MELSDLKYGKRVFWKGWSLIVLGADYSNSMVTASPLQIDPLEATKEMIEAAEGLGYSLEKMTSNMRPFFQVHVDELSEQNSGQPQEVQPNGKLKSRGAKLKGGKNG